jgi:hypothetical protein
VLVIFFVCVAFSFHLILAVSSFPFVSVSLASLSNQSSVRRIRSFLIASDSCFPSKIRSLVLRKNKQAIAIDLQACSYPGLGDRSSTKKVWEPPRSPRARDCLPPGETARSSEGMATCSRSHDHRGRLVSSARRACRGLSARSANPIHRLLRRGKPAPRTLKGVCALLGWAH